MRIFLYAFISAAALAWVAFPVDVAASVTSPSVPAEQVDDNTENTCISSQSNKPHSPLDIPTVKLHNGVEMPILILGAAQLVTVKGIKPELPSNFVGMLPERGLRQVELALQQGIRAFDTAFIYRTSRSIGYVLGEWFRQGALRREDVWITSKIFHPDARDFSFEIVQMPDMPLMSPLEVKKETRKHFEQNLYDLNMGYVDLMLLHWPADDKEGNERDNRARRLAAWQVLEEMYDKGWARAIGVSNFSPTHFDQLKSDGARITPMVNQFEASVTLQYPDILQYCLDNDIVPQAYSPLGRGIKDLPDEVSELANKYNKDVGQIVFRYLVQLGYTLTPLTNNEQRMVSNTNLFDFELSHEEMKRLSNLNRPDGGWGLPDPHNIE